MGEGYRAVTGSSYGKFTDVHNCYLKTIWIKRFMEKRRVTSILSTFLALIPYSIYTVLISWNYQLPTFLNMTPGFMVMRHLAAGYGWGCPLPSLSWLWITWPETNVWWYQVRISNILYPIGKVKGGGPHIYLSSMKKFLSKKMA